MDSDNRPWAGDLLAAMWDHVCKRSLLKLRRIYFEAVTEAHTRQVVSETVCPSMRIGWDQTENRPVGPIILYRPGRGYSSDNDDAFNKMRGQSELVKIVEGMPTIYTQMVQRHRLIFGEISIIPACDKEGRGVFDVEVLLEDSDDP